MSSLVVGGQPSGLLVLFNGGQKEVTAITKATVAAGTLVLTSAQLENPELVGVENNFAPIVQAYGAYAAGDLVWTVSSAEELQLVGADSQPVIMTPVLGAALVP